MAPSRSSRPIHGTHHDQTTARSTRVHRNEVDVFAHFVQLCPSRHRSDIRKVGLTEALTTERLLPERLYPRPPLPQSISNHHTRTTLTPHHNTSFPNTPQHLQTPPNTSTHNQHHPTQTIPNPDYKPFLTSLSPDPRTR